VLVGVRPRVVVVDFVEDQRVGVREASGDEPARDFTPYLFVYQAYITFQVHAWKPFKSRCSSVVCTSSISLNCKSLPSNTVHLHAHAAPDVLRQIHIQLSARRIRIHLETVWRFQARSSQLEARSCCVTTRKTHPRKRRRHGAVGGVVGGYQAHLDAVAHHNVSVRR
jgi:hypothetical protein